MRSWLTSVMIRNGENGVKFIKDGFWKHGRFYSSHKPLKYVFPIDAVRDNPATSHLGELMLIPCSGRAEQAGPVSQILPDCARREIVHLCAQHIREKAEDPGPWHGHWHLGHYSRRGVSLACGNM